MKMKLINSEKERGNAGGEMIASLDAESDFTRKILRKINPN